MRHLLIPLLIFFLICGGVFLAISWWQGDSSWKGQVDQQSQTLWAHDLEGLRALRPAFLEEVSGAGTRWSDLSPEGRSQAKQAWENWSLWLEEMESASLSPDELIQWQALKKQADIRLASWEVQHGFWDMSFPSLPDQLFLSMMNEVPILSEDQAKDFISSLHRLEAYLDGWEASFRQAWNQGIQPPTWALDSLINRLNYFAGVAPDQLPLYQDLAFKLSTIDPVAMNEYRAGEFLEQAERFGRTEVQPAFLKLASRLTEFRKVAQADSLGTGFHPNRQAAYALAVLQQSSLDFAEPAVLRAIDSVSSQVKQQLQLYRDSLGTAAKPPKTTADFAASAEAVQKTLRDMKVYLGGILHQIPQRRLSAYPYPAYQPSLTELPLYYHPGSLDQAQPARLFLSEEHAQSTSLQALNWAAYQQGLPGQHYLFYQIHQNDSLPALLRQSWYPAFQQGWEAYMNEQLDQSLALFSGDLADKIHYLEKKLLHLTLARLDVTLHLQGWSKERAIRFLTSECPEVSEGGYATTIVEKAILQPGHFVGSFLGYSTWQGLYLQGRAQLSWQLNLPDFHAHCLSNGFIPLSVLKDLGNSYFVENLAK
ncbi:MAG: DUF885 family protein [Bacteroidota bacterium]